MKRGGEWQDLAYLVASLDQTHAVLGDGRCMPLTGPARTKPQERRGKADSDEVEGPSSAAGAESRA